MIRAAVLGLAVLAAPAAAQAQEACPHPPEIGQVVIPPAPCTEFSASYTGASRAYPHGVLGDKEEFTTLVVKYRDTEIRRKVPSIRVFEDLHPRMANLDDTPNPEVIVVESDHTAGSRLVVYAIESGRSPTLTRLAATGPLGQAYRWLAPVGMADFDGDGHNDIAYVETPHLGKTLRIVTLRDEELVELASGEGYSNHRIGDAFIMGGVRDCGDGAEAVTANGEWSEILATRLVDGALESRVLGRFDGPESFDAALDCQP